VYKSRFTYFGQVGLTFTLGLCVLAALIGVFFGFNEIPDKDRWFLIYGSPFILFVVIFVWRKILVEINEIEIADTRIIFKNVLTGRRFELRKSKLKGYKDSFRNGYKILLVDQSGNVVGKVHEHYYKDFKGLIDNLGLNYIGRIPNFWDKFFKVEAKE
jgi:hypothetical protein